MLVGRLARMEGSKKGERVGGGVRIMVVKPLFPPGEKKGVNDTLELPTPSLPLLPLLYGG